MANTTDRFRRPCPKLCSYPGKQPGIAKVDVQVGDPREVLPAISRRVVLVLLQKIVSFRQARMKPSEASGILGVGARNRVEDSGWVRAVPGETFLRGWKGYGGDSSGGGGHGRRGRGSRRRFGLGSEGGRAIWDSPDGQSTGGRLLLAQGTGRRWECCQEAGHGEARCQKPGYTGACSQEPDQGAVRGDRALGI
jgi:hypothetical protein